MFDQTSLPERIGEEIGEDGHHIHGILRLLEESTGDQISEQDVFRLEVVQVSAEAGKADQVTSLVDQVQPVEEVQRVQSMETGLRQ